MDIVQPRWNEKLNLEINEIASQISPEAPQQFSQFAQSLPADRSVSQAPKRNRRSKPLSRKQVKPRSEQFELCQSDLTFAEAGEDSRSNDTSGMNVAQCAENIQTPLFMPTETSPFYQTGCCDVEKTFCAGCAQLDLEGKTCETCSGGYTYNSTLGICVACMDQPKWTDKDGGNCYDATCSADPFQGFSANEACCKCGGGHRAATPFTYFVGPMALGDHTVVGHPVPRTATKYSVDEDAADCAWPDIVTLQIIAICFCITSKRNETFRNATVV